MSTFQGVDGDKLTGGGGSADTLLYSLYMADYDTITTEDQLTIKRLKPEVGGKKWKFEGRTLGGVWVWGKTRADVVEKVEKKLEQIEHARKMRKLGDADAEERNRGDI